MTPRHIAFIPDGNRRKATRDGISVRDTYLIGAQKGLEIIGWCREVGVKHWTGFGASHENVLKRPQEQIVAMFGGALKLCQEITKIQGLKLHVFGDIAGINASFPPSWKEEFLEFQRQGQLEGEFVVHVGVNYSASADLRTLASNARRNTKDIMAVGLHDMLMSAGVPDVELLIRTGGRQRLSGFLPHQLGYAELYFLPVLWSEFSREDLNHALEWFAEQDRNFGE
jgi:undecaprenyl diphosphate synthase